MLGSAFARPLLGLMSWPLQVNVVMKVKISELKARLSAYLHAVRDGKTVTVLDRRTPIARIVPIEEEQEDLQVVSATRPVSDIGRVRGAPTKRPVDVVRLL